MVSSNLIRWFALGYDSLSVSKKLEPDVQLKIKLHDNFEKSHNRRPVQVFCGAGTTLCALPKIDTAPTNMIVGLAGRLGTKHLVPNVGLFDEFSTFVDTVLKTHPVFSVPCDIPVHEDLQEWFLENTNYEKFRKDELRHCYAESSDFEWLVSGTVNKCHLKDECYTECKLARDIFSRTDVFKMIFGPLTKMIEKHVYAMDEFVKHIPFINRATHVSEHLGGDWEFKFSNDFSAFESLFSKDLMRACECKLYVTQLGPQFKGLISIINNVLTGKNVLKFRTFTGSLNARRMSGEMCTSLGNGFTNLMVNWFILHKSGYSINDIFSKTMCVVEGDDSLCVSNKSVDMKIYEGLGLRAKVQYHDEIGDASFCGMLFDAEDGTIVADVNKQIVGMSWTSMKYAGSKQQKLHTLLRSKAMCLAYQYRGCPMLDVYCHKILQLTKSLDVRHIMLDPYKQQIFEEAQKAAKNIIALGPKPPSMTCRLFVERKLGYSVEFQMMFEASVEKFTLGFNDSIIDVATEAQVSYARQCVVPGLDGNAIRNFGPRLSEEMITSMQECFSSPLDRSRFEKAARGHLDGD